MRWRNVLWTSARMSSTRDVDRPFEQGAGFGAQHQVLRRPQPGAPTDPLVDEVGRAGLPGPAGGGQAHGVAHDVLGDRHALHDLVEPPHVLAGEERLQSVRAASRWSA